PSARPAGHTSTPSFPTRRSSDLLDIDVAEVSRPHGWNADGYMALRRLRAEQIPDPARARFSREPQLANGQLVEHREQPAGELWLDRKSTRLNSSHLGISYAVFCL